ncbi:MAG: hypothetical protein KC449_09655 [Anaerolineales bacterium]|nr:hypothetical protein [Anaerolineales bacterium]
MNKQLFYVSEEHISEQATPLDARKVIELLQAEGWTVAYGDQPWEFADEGQQANFMQAFKWSLAVLEADKSYTGDGRFKELAQQRVKQNGLLQPHEEHLMQPRNWPGYWRWLIGAPLDVIVTWIKIDKKKDVASS